MFALQDSARSNAYARPQSSISLREAIKKTLCQRDEVLHFRDVITKETNLKKLMGVYFSDVFTRPTHRKLEQAMSQFCGFEVEAFHAVASG